MSFAKHILPISIMAGAIIGAGIFSLPYIFVQIGILNGLFILILTTIVVTLIHLFYADLIIRTKGHHNFVGFARMYLGETGSFFSIIIAVAQMLLVLAIYLVLSQSFANLVLGSASPLSLFFFWAFGTTIIFLTLRRMAFLEFLITAGMIGIILLIFVVALPVIFKTSLEETRLAVGGVLSPVGPILFALAGRVAILAAVKSAGRQLPRIRGLIILGTVIPAVVYFIFVLAVAALSATVSEDAVSGLMGQLSPVYLILIGILGWLSLWSSYIIIGFNVNDILKIDLRWPDLLRVLTIALIPLFFYQVSSHDFIKLVSFAGGVFFALEAVLIIIMWLRAREITRGPALLKNMPLPLVALLTIFFAAVMINQIYGMF